MIYVILVILIIFISLLFASFLIREKNISSQLQAQKQALENELNSQKAVASSYNEVLNNIKNTANKGYLYGELLAETELNSDQKDLLMELLLANESIIHIIKNNSV